MLKSHRLASTEIPLLLPCCWPVNAPPMLSGNPSKPKIIRSKDAHLCQSKTNSLDTDPSARSTTAIGPPTRTSALRLPSDAWNPPRRANPHSRPTVVSSGRGTTAEAPSSSRQNLYYYHHHHHHHHEVSGRMLHKPPQVPSSSTHVGRLIHCASKQADPARAYPYSPLVAPGIRPSATADQSQLSNLTRAAWYSVGGVVSSPGGGMMSCGGTWFCWRGSG
jgi:hypothetical protein